MDWSGDLSIGVGEIDKQHQEIFHIYNAFIGACKAGEGRRKLSGLLEFLTNYTQEHFRHEEDIMDQHQYPDKGAHKNSHKEFAVTVSKFKMRMEMEGSTVGLITEINQTVNSWLINHIKKTDHELGSYMNLKWGFY